VDLSGVIAWGLKMSIEQTIVNYGLAGVVIYIFYRLISNELRELKEEVRKLRESIDALIQALRSTKVAQDRGP
jgi:tetrahydromethanopterin S-methyltransferase subunit B